MFVLRSSISVQVSKKRLGIINKQGGPTKHCGGRRGYKKIQKLIAGADVYLALKSNNASVLFFGKECKFLRCHVDLLKQINLLDQS